MKNKIKYLVSFLLILGIILYLVSTTLKSSLQYYVTVSELRASEIDYRDRTLKVAGKAHDIKRSDSDEGPLYSFLVKEGGLEIPVTYVGLAPDTFKEGSDVVVTGHLSEEGQFEGEEILAKCASKYEEKIKD